MAGGGFVGCLVESAEAELVSGFGCDSVFEEDFYHFFAGDGVVTVVLE